MDDATRQALLELNRRFYERWAAEFSRSRERPWPGWERLLPLLPPDEPLAVLDVGCGNARLATFLAERRGGRLAYLGLDGSPDLLAAAGERLAALADAGHAAAVERLELLGPDLERRLGGRRFHLVALFGLLHHVPGQRSRQELVVRLASAVAPGGVLALSLWRFDREARFAAKVVPWEEHNRRSETPIDLAQLEPGDHLLGWGGRRDVPRYCHLADDAEADTLAGASSLPLAARFAADGASGDANLYLVFGGRRLC